MVLSSVKSLEAQRQAAIKVKSTTAGGTNTTKSRNSVCRIYIHLDSVYRPVVLKWLIARRLAGVGLRDDHGRRAASRG